MQTRRELLKVSLLLPAVGLSFPNGAASLEQDCLSAESAEGYRSVLAASDRLAIVPAVRATSLPHLLELRARAQQGAWVIWESAAQFCDSEVARVQSRLLRDVLGICTAPPQAVSHGDDGSDCYVRFRSPHAALIRTFGGIVPVRCGPGDEAMAVFASTNVAMKCRVGRGGVIFLGTVLGAHAKAGDTDARKLIAELANVRS